MATTYPELAKEWHPTKNGSLNPCDVTYGSEKKVWWYLPYDDPKTGKHYDFEWKAIIYARTSGAGCPFLSESIGERFVRKYLSANAIMYEEQKSFEELVGTGGAHLSYDFFLDHSGILIEYQGIQHYKAIDFFGGKEQLKKQKEHDLRKRQFAAKSGYQLIEISYKYDTYDVVADYLNQNLLPLLQRE